MPDDLKPGDEISGPPPGAQVRIVAVDEKDETYTIEWEEGGCTFTCSGVPEDAIAKRLTQ
jgi:hypothetical protein